MTVTVEKPGTELGMNMALKAYRSGGGIASMAAVALMILDDGVLDEAIEFNDKHEAHSMGRLVDHHRAWVPIVSLEPGQTHCDS